MIMWGMGNKVAAMPSLHCGIACLVALYGISRLRTSWPAGCCSLYPAAMALALTYFAEHYVIDAICGCALAGLVMLGVGRWERQAARRRLSSRRAVRVSAVSRLRTRPTAYSSRSLPLHHLAGGRARELVAEVELPRHLEVRDALAGVRRQLGRELVTGSRRRGGLDERHDPLAHLVVGHADHGDVGDGRVQG